MTVHFPTATAASSTAEPVSAVARAALTRALQRHGHRREALLQILLEVQEATAWLPRSVLAAVAEGVGLTPAIVEGVASFYRFLHLQPVGRIHLLFSDNITDRMLGSRALAHALCRRLGIEPGPPFGNTAVSVGFASCTGLGDQGPAVLVNQQQVLTRLTPERVAELAERLLAGQGPAQWPTEWQQVQPQVRRADLLLNAEPFRGPALDAMVGRGTDATWAELAASHLRGRGGAGFATATKWQLAAAAPVPPGGTRVVVCNADEGEPGTFKDRVLLMTQADTVFEGMTVAARLLGAQAGFVYLRGEYRWLLEPLLATLARRRAAGLLGRCIRGVDGFDFDIQIHLGAGAYVCGEESALLESLEGKRGTPRIRPPFPVEKGYLGQPTVVNNVETFCAAAHVARTGGAAWAARGTPASSGTKLHAVSGDVARPGVYEFAFGVSVSEVLHAAGAFDDGRRPQAVQVGGPSGVCLAEPEFGRRLAFEDVPTAGAFMVFDCSRDMFEVARCFAHFFAHESCGFCTPCRVGTALVARRLDKLADGHGSLFDEAELRQLDAVMHGSTHCGLGATAANPLRDTLQRFRPAYLRRLQQPRFVPGFDLDAELAAARRVTGRDDPLAHLERVG